MSLDIVRRSEWGAAPPRCTPSRVNWPTGVDLWVHHTAGPPSQTVRQIQAFHQGPSRGWCDIGYGYLVDEAGKVYEGRGFEVHAAHCPGHNHQPSISMIGTYTDRSPTDKQHEGVCALMDMLDAGDLRGHREGSSTGTTCPGNRGMSEVVNAGCATVPIGRPRFYFEELPFSQDGHGPVIGGDSDGYRLRAVRDTKLALFKAAHPLTPTSTMRSGDDSTGDVQARGRNGDEIHGDDWLYWYLIWQQGTQGAQYRFGPWRSAVDRDAARKEREKNTGRKMRPFDGRIRSLYPWPT